MWWPRPKVPGRRPGSCFATRRPCPDTSSSGSGSSGSAPTARLSPMAPALPWPLPAPDVARYVAFLGAINVGGHTVKMADLRRSFEAMGLTSVETFIASGNVGFEAATSDNAALERRIEAGLQADLGYRVDTFVRSSAEVAAIAAH